MIQDVSWEHKAKTYIVDLTRNNKRKKATARNQLLKMGRLLDSQNSAIKHFKQYGWN